MASTLANPSPALCNLLLTVALLGGADEERGERWLLTGVPLTAKRKAHGIIWLENDEPRAKLFPTAAKARAAWDQTRERTGTT